MGESADCIKGEAFGLRKGTDVEEKSKLFQRTRPMRYVSLHHHSTFSYLDGYQMPAAHVRRAGELNMAALALTEHGNMSSASKLEVAAVKQGVKPIFGCELYTGTVGETARQLKNHLTVLAETQEGYRNLLRVVTQSWKDYYYAPTTSWASLTSHKTGLIVLSGCTGSLLATSLIGGKNVSVEDASLSRGRDIARRFKKVFGDAYYIEVQAFPELENVVQLNGMLAEIARDLNIPLVATGDCHYTRLEESELQLILHNVRGGHKQTLEEQTRNWGYDVPLSPPLSDMAVYRRLMGTGLTKGQALEAIASTEEIAQRCTVTLPKLPQLRWQDGDALGTWRKWIQEGWVYRGIHKKAANVRRQYKEKLLYEISIIEEKDFVDYFLVVSDIVKYAKDSGIAVGAARGSAAASLVCFLLRITEVDPLLFPGLIFERFIDLTRTDLPDIDLDFDSDGRTDVREYAVRKYGRESVANIGTFTFYKSKNSLDDVARVYKIPTYEVESIKEVLITRSSGDLRASATIEDTVEQFEQAAEVIKRHPDLSRAMLLEGNVKGMGVHAAGLVISNGPITDICAVYERKVKDEIYQVVALDKEDAELYGMLKIDLLGLNTMSVLSECLVQVGMTLNDLYAIDLEDSVTLEGFRRNDVVGVFQFDGRAMRSVNGALKPDNFKEVCDVNALARPGPLHSSATAEYIDIKWGKRAPERIHPLYDAIAEPTHYQIVYQEQILRIVREIGGFDWVAAAYIRKIISKKLGEQEFSRQWEKFWQGAEQAGLEESQARKIWGFCITAGAYAFNQAHCVSYGMLAWWTMWFKQHYPLEFYAASLRKMNPDRQLEYLRDAKRHDIEAEPPDPEYSTASWTAADGRLMGGLTQIKGIGPRMAPAMVEFREEHGVKRWEDYALLKGIGPKRIQSFYDFCDSDDPYGVHRLQRMLDSVRGDLVSMGLPRQTHRSLDVPYERGEDTECVWLGVIVHKNLRDLFESHFARTGEQLSPDDVKDPNLKEWVIALGQDEDDIVTITWDRWLYPRCKRAVWSIRNDADVVLVRGTKRGFQARRAIYVRDFWVIDPE